MTTLTSRLVGVRGTAVTLLSAAVHIERIWLEEGILGAAADLGADPWDIEHRPEVTVSINSKEHSTADYRRLQLPSGSELLLVIIRLPERKGDTPEVSRYALLLVQRLQASDGMAQWEMPEGARLVMLCSTEDENLGAFFGRSDLEQLRLLGVR